MNLPFYSIAPVFVASRSHALDLSVSGTEFPFSFSSNFVSIFLPVVSSTE